MSRDITIYLIAAIKRERSYDFSGKEDLRLISARDACNQRVIY